MLQVMGLTSWNDVLQKILQKNPKIKERLLEAEAVQAWDEAVGPQIAQNAKALRVENGCLYVEVGHSLWKTELHHRKHQILEKINAKAVNGQWVIKDLFFVEPRKPSKPRDSKYSK